MKITTKYLTDYLRLQAHKRQLEQQARNLGALIGVMEAELLEQAMTAEGEEKRTIRVCGFDIVCEHKAGKISWKTELMKALGDKAAATVRAITNRAKKAWKLTKVEPASPAAKQLAAGIEADAKKKQSKIAA